MKPNDNQIKQAAMLLEQIATMAMVIDQIFFHGATASDSIEAFENQNYVVRHLVSQLGLLADIGTGKLDGSEIPNVFGGAENWLTTQAYLEKTEVQS